MRTLMNRRISVCVAGLLLLLPSLALRAEPAAPPPGLGRYVMVLWEPGTPVGEGQVRRVPEPDIPALGGSVLHARDNQRIIHLPLSAAKQLRRHEAVMYLQRLWTGESFEDWDETYPADGRLDARSESDTNLTWGPKPYAYDGSGNITQFGDDYYVYDSAARLVKTSPVTGDTTGKTETYRYDSFGNLTEKAVTGTNPVRIPVDGQSNRVIGASYDAAGNVTSRDGRHVYVWDNVGMLTATSVTIPGRRIVYDAADERIGTLMADNVKSRWTIRDLDGQIMREFRGDMYVDGMYWIWKQDHVRADGVLVSGETQQWGYAGSSDPIQYGGLRHYHLDHLGSVRMVTNAAGKSISEHDYFPFGKTTTRTYQEEVGSGDPHVDGMRFAGHWRDFLGILNVENDDYLDYMHARYYDPKMGRFLSPDPLDGKQRVPQSWNRYAYALNNPLKYTDPTGMYVFAACSGTEEQCKADQSAFEAARQANLQSNDEAVRNAALAYGDPGVDNGVTVGFGNMTPGTDGSVTPQLQGREDGTMGMMASVMFQTGLTGTALRGAVGHEGTHILNAQAFAASFTRNAASWDITKNLTAYQTETNAYRVTHSIFRAANATFDAGCQGCRLGTAANTPADVDLAIRRILQNPQGPYRLTPTNQGPRQFPEWTTPP